MNQTEKILKHLQAGAEITPLEALYKFGCMRLGARIWELRERGYLIDSRIVSKNGKHFSSYKLQGGHNETI